MHLPIRVRLALFFSCLFGFLLLLSFGILFQQMFKSLRRDFHSEMVHDGRIIAELFKEELKLNALKEFEEEIEEFGIDVQVLDHDKNVIVESKGWKKTGFVINEAILAAIQEAPSFKEIKINKDPHAVFSRLILLPSHKPYSLHIVRTQKAMKKIPRKLLHLMFVIAPIMIIIGAFAGHVFSSNALSAVERIRKKADSIYAEDLSARLPVPSQRDELYYLTETLNRMLNRMQDAFERLKNFTADASHELRIPLTALRGNLEVALRKERTVEEYRETIKDALEEAVSLSQLTQDLLLLSLTDAGEMKLNIREVKIKNFLEEIFSQGQTLNRNERIKMTLISAPDIAGKFDLERIREVLLNLIDNAIKYNRQDGEVILGAESTGDGLKFTVQDSGIGISKDSRHKIFDRFYRVDKARSRQQGGTGLGLSIARAIVEAHNGRIDVESDQMKGTVFTVTIPQIGDHT